MDKPSPNEPVAPLHALQSELRRLMERYQGWSAGGENTPWSPPIDLYETSDAIGLWVDLPGVDPQSIELTVTGRVLTLRGLKPSEPHPTGQGETLERFFGPFLREIDLDADVDIDAVEASTAHGVLHVRLPKTEAVRPRTIPIKTA